MYKFDAMDSITWQQAERLFKTSGPISHINSGSLEDGFIFENDDERNLALLYMALAADQAGVSILAYALMTNHFHFIVRGSHGKEFFQYFRDRMSGYLSRHQRAGLLDKMDFKETAITSLNQFYVEVAYVIRNPYVISRNVHLFAYTWSSGYLYFNPFIAKIPVKKASELKYRELRQITKSRDTVLPEWVLISDNALNPICFVDYRLVEMLFRTPQEFISHCFRNVEAQVEVAASMNEKPLLTDDDLFRLIRKRMEKEYGAKEYSLLSEKQRIEVLKYLKYELSASNGQIARVLKLRQSAVDAIFPITAKRPWGT